jgi:hypothetical protein
MRAGGRVPALPRNCGFEVRPKCAVASRGSLKQMRRVEVVTRPCAPPAGRVGNGQRTGILGLTLLRHVGGPLALTCGTARSGCHGPFSTGAAGRANWSGGSRRSSRPCLAGAAALGAALPEGPAAAGRAQERRADGGAGGAGRGAAAAPLRRRLALGCGAAGGGARPGGRPAGGRPGRGAGGRRHRVGEARRPLGGRAAPVLRRAGQEGELPGAGLADAGPRRGAGLRRPAPVLAGAVGRECGAAPAGRGAR